MTSNPLLARSGIWKKIKLPQAQNLSNKLIRIHFPFALQYWRIARIENIHAMFDQAVYIDDKQRILDTE